MFQTYIKSLNDMVFSTSENPEEQPSTGVLGRIGSWFSPWKGKSPQSPEENASISSEEAPKTEGDKESGESEGPQPGEQQWQEKEHSSNPNPLGLLSRDSVFCEEKDATQSTHKHSSTGSSTETRAGRPKEEEFVDCTEKRTGQGKGREESSNGASVSGILDKNASHLTHLSCSSKQGVVWDSDRAHAQPQARRQAQAQTGKRLHVYLEETSLIKSEKDHSISQEVTRTKVSENLRVLQKSKPLVNSSANVKSLKEAQHYYSGLKGVKLNSNKDSQLETKPDKEQTESDAMGRKNSSRRKIRKTSQGEGEDSSPTKISSMAPVPEGFPSSDKSVTSPQGKSPKTHMGESSVNSTQASPEGGESQTSCPDNVKELGNCKDSNSVTEHTLVCVVDGNADMEDDDSFYKVERKTETPESKRRSIKVSQSQVKLFSKNVPLGNTKDEEKVNGKTETDARPHDLKKTDEEETKPVIGRITDKISLFERQHLAGGSKQAFQTPRSADVSPARKVTEKLKTEFESDQRSRSVERQTARSSSASPAREKSMTLKERMRNFTEASATDAKPALPQRTAMAGMSQKTTSSVAVAASKLKLDNQGKLDTNGQITEKPDGQDTATVGVKLPKQQAHPKSKDMVASKTIGESTTPISVEPDAPAKGTASGVSLQTKGPNRAGSHSKRKKGKDPIMSPNTEKKPTSKAEVTASKQELVDNSKQLTDNVSLKSDTVQENTAEKQALSDTKNQAFKKEVEVQEKEKQQLDSSSKTDKPDKRQKGLPKPSVIKDKPDTSVSNHATKKPIDKEPVILPQKEERAGGDNHDFTQDREASKDGRENSDSSPSPAPNSPVEETVSGEQDSPLSQPSEQHQQNKEGPGPIALDQRSKNVEKREKAGGEKTNHTERKDQEKPQQLVHSDKNTTNRKVSEDGQGISETNSAARDDERKNAERKEQPKPIKDIKHGANPPQPASQSSEKTNALSEGLPGPAEVQHVSQMEAAPPEKAAITQTNEAVSRTNSDKAPAEGEMTTTVPPQKSAESSGTEAESVVSAAQAKSVSVEKTKNSPDDSHTHGANDAELSSPKPITQATAAAEKVTVKATNDTPVLITAQAGNIAENQSTVKKPSSVSVSKPVSSQAEGRYGGKKGSTVKTVSSEKTSGDINKVHPSPSPKGAEERAQRPSTSNVSKSTVNMAEKTAEKTVNELSPVANGDNSLNPQLLTAKKELVSNKPSASQKAPTSQEAKNLSPISSQRAPMKKLHLPWGLSKDDSVKEQDVPSSWLDLDFPKDKFKAQSPNKLSSSGSESNLLDTSGDLDDDEFVEKIKNLCAPFSLPPKKHNQPRPPQPSFAMPAIKEDRFEKPFDPDEFKFGLRKKNQFTLEGTGLMAKLQTTEIKSGLKPARASLADRSLLLSCLEGDSRIKDKAPVKDEVDSKEEKDDKLKVKSRLEGSCVLSSLSSSTRGKRNGLQTKEEGTIFENGSSAKIPRQSPPPSPQPHPPNQTSTAPAKDTLAKQSPVLSNTKEPRAAEAVVSDSCPPLPSFNDIKLPDYLEKYLRREPAKPVQSKQAQEPVNNKDTGKMTSPVPREEADLPVKPGPALPDAKPPCFPAIAPSPKPTLPKQPQGKRHNPIRAAKGFHKRAGKIVLFEKAEFGGKSYEIYRDVADATSLQLSPLISVNVIRGCWVLYERPDFQGRTIALEEGVMELTNLWAEPDSTTEPGNNPPMLIGSIRLAVWDYSIPHIDLFTEPEGHGRVTPYHDDTIETGSFGIPVSTASIQVHSGVWLVFSDPGFQGMVAVLEAGEYPFPDAWGFPSPFVGSLRPLKMGGFKVEHPNDVKAVVYEKPDFEGSSVEIESDIFSFCEDEEDAAADSATPITRKLKSVGSLKIIGGFWVGYSLPGFEGQQFVLEEGEYLNSSDWGGSDQLLSLRPILADFLSPHIKMFKDRDFGKVGVNIDLTEPVPNMEDTDYGMKTQSIDVIGGVWVAFEKPGFGGESYILEKGLYGSPEDWGALQPKIASVMPVTLDEFEHDAKFKVQIFSEPGFQGSVLTLEDDTTSLPADFCVASCKVLAGNWLAHEGQGFSGRVYVLEVGSYPDLGSMGCVNVNSSILSLQTSGFEFSLPSITLFERGGLRGKRVVLTDSAVNLQMVGGCSRVHSVLVEGGMWVLYNGINYRGAQILLKPGEIVDWHKFSGWNKIGSLRPLMQKQVHFRLKNRMTGLMMSVTGDLDEVKLLRIQEMEPSDGYEQIWLYREGHIYCKVLEECCLSPTGSVTIAGSRVGLTPAHENPVHRWSITPEGFIQYSPSPDLVLDVKGGHHYDKSQVILNTRDRKKIQQKWTMEII